MTREEHIIYAQNLRVALRMMNCFSAETMESLDMAIKALEKEPILDKVRAEIADLDDTDYDYEGYYKAVTDALQIIDKYKAEM